MDKKKKIFDTDQPLTSKEIKSYLKDDLSASEKYQLEQKIAANEFNSDAIEGFENTPGSLEGFTALQNKFHSNLPRKSSNGFWKFEYSILLVLGLAVGIYFVGHYFLVQAELKKEAFDKQVIVKNQQLNNDIAKPIVIQPITELDDNEIEEATLIEESKQLTSAKVISESPIVISMDSINNRTEEIDSTINTIHLDKKVVNLELKEKKEVPPVNKTKVVYSNTKTLFLSQLLVVDYREIYTEQITLPNFELTGTPADKENKLDTSSKDLELTSFTKKIPYVEFLESTQLKFRKNQFKDALKDYRTILNQYPDDINAHFYSALCYYNINKQKKAIQHFDRVLENDYNTFDEEAKWYKALSYYELGKTSQCITLLNQIANANGFYAVKANNLLNDI